MKQKPHLTKLIQILGVLLIVGVAVSVATIEVIGSYHDFSRSSEKVRADYVSRQKQIIKQEVMRVANFIAYEKSQNKILVREKIKSRVNEAFSIAQNIYQQNKSIKSKAEIQKMIVDALREIRFENGSGYYFITCFSGTEVLFADKPELEGMNLTEIQDTRGQYVIQDMSKIARQSGEGFYEYHWTKPKAKGNDHKKISFVKQFPPYDWFIGTGLYVEDIDEQIKISLLSTICRIRFGKEGYVFVNGFNGDALVSNGRYIGGRKKLWEVFSKNPEKAKHIFNISSKAALTPGGAYVYYSLIKLTDSTKESPKTSFVYAIPEFQMYIGAGVYLDDVEADIAVMQVGLTENIKEKMLLFFLITLGILAFFLFIFSRFTRILKSDFTLFGLFFKQASVSNEPINRKQVHFAELDLMAENANKMLEDKIRSEKDKEELTGKLHVAQKMESIGLMAGGVAHDLNNILSGIVAYPELILQKLDKDSEFRAPIEAIKESGQRAATVVADLLTVARSTASIREVHDLNILVLEYLRSPECVKLKSFSSDTVFHHHLQATQAEILCSPVHIKKCLMNLVINASEAIVGHGQISISTDERHVDEAVERLAGLETGEYVVLSVEDSGSGIAAEDLGHVFEPFYTKKVMGRSGTGLGLAVVWNTVEDHDGKIFIESSSKGTCFQLYFPKSNVPRTAQPEDEVLEKLRGNGEHILIVDDEPQLREIASQILTTIGYRVDVVASGELAIEFVKESPVDLIVLDMLMEPGLNGRETYEQIIETNPEQRAIIASGFSESDEVKTALRLGVSAFIEKPYSVSRLGRAVRDALSTR